MSAETAAIRREANYRRPPIAATVRSPPFAERLTAAVRREADCRPAATVLQEAVREEPLLSTERLTDVRPPPFAKRQTANVRREADCGPTIAVRQEANCCRLQRTAAVRREADCRPAVVRREADRHCPPRGRLLSDRHRP